MLGELVTGIIALLIIAGVVIWSFVDPGAMGTAEHAAKVIAILAGGLWVLYQFALRRAFESTLVINVSVHSVPYGNDRYRAFVQVELANTANRRIYAAKRLSDAEKVEYEQSVTYPCDLQIRRVGDSNATYVYDDWWGSAKEHDGAYHISVLAEYSLGDETIDFFMEPGEKYFLGHLFDMPSGHYVAKVVFVGSRAGAAEYWSRIVFFCVPHSHNHSKMRVLS